MFWGLNRRILFIHSSMYPSVKVKFKTQHKCLLQSFFKFPSLTCSYWPRLPRVITSIFLHRSSQPSVICLRVSLCLLELIILTSSCCPPPWCRYCEEIPPEENEAQDTCTKTPEVKMDTSPQLPKKSFTSNNLPSTGSGETPCHVRTKQIMYNPTVWVYHQELLKQQYKLK